MYPVFIVAINTFKEGLRKKFLLSLAIVCFFILCMSLLFGQLSLDEKIRLMINFGLVAVQLSLLILSVFLGNYFISGDLEKKILLTILVRPIRPAFFFLGRYLGLSFILFVSLVFLSSVLGLFFMYLQIPFSPTLIQSLFGLYLESLLMLAFVLFFASYSNSFLVLVYSFSLFLIGHFSSSLNYFIKEGQGLWSFLGSKIFFIIPDLERVNWKSAVVYGDVLSLNEVFMSSLYIVFWISFVLSLACIILEKRDYS